jgi:uncharacterized protein (DUF1800 family)
MPLPQPSALLGPDRTQSDVPVPSAAVPAVEFLALNRMGYGPRPEDPAHVRAMGLEAYIDEQLNPGTISDTLCDQKLATARLRISYPAGVSYPARDEAVGLNFLNSSVAELWARANFGMEQAWQERMRPWDEVRVAAYLRAIYSKRQLQELLVEFWHNHFSVNPGADAAISAGFPAYDRLMRQHCLGNFRTFLEEVAKSTAMLYSLDNVSNRVSGGEGGNENYARELFELHTLGSDNYLKFYDDRQGVGTITYGAETFARGYIDDDVYEAARCLTGWTVANGHWERPAQNDGSFLYDPDWHDTAPKMVLSTDGRANIPRNQPDMKDGRDVLDLLARHPGTARTICTKLCRRLISDNPPQSIVDAAVSEWMASRSAPDQIKRVVRLILRSPEFRASWGQKVKRPFEFLVSYLRATGAEISVADTASDDGDHWSSVFYVTGLSGHRLFEWPTPTGHPDLASYWLSTNGMLRRWNLPFVLAQPWGGNVAVNLRAQTDAGVPGGSVTRVVDYWIGRLCGGVVSSRVRQELITFLAQGGDVNQPPRPTSRAPDWNDQAGVTDRINAMVQLLAMSPDFQYR